MSFDRIEHSDGIFNRIKLYYVHDKMFFLIESFLVVENYELSNNTSHLLSVPLTPECVRTLSWSISFFLLLQLSPWWCSVQDHYLTCRSNCNLILKIKIVGKYLYFSLATFWFWGLKIWYLKLSIQTHRLKATI